jgi:polysaccharide export outer membrane protein
MRLLVLACLASGCSTLPAVGPTSTAIDKAAAGVVSTSEDVLPFLIVEISAATLPADNSAAQGFPPAFQKQGFATSDETIRVADRLEIRIWELSEDGLFATEGRRETVFETTVGNAGQISVPYANAVAVFGLTTAQLREELIERYSGQAVEPEIAVRIAETQSRTATVLGAIRSPGRLPVASNGVRLLDLIAQAGGTSQPDWEIRVTVQRAGTMATVLLADVMRHAANNIVVHPGDVVSLAHAPRRFPVYGAVARPGTVEVPKADADLAYLLAEAGGLNAMVSEARSVFVFRPAAVTDAVRSTPATAYRFDFARPDAFLLAGMFRMEPTDIVYVATADAADFQRFVAVLLSPLLGTASRAQAVGD